jgi:hypothetical protein
LAGILGIGWGFFGSRSEFHSSRWKMVSYFCGFLPLLVGVLFFALGIALLVLTLKSKMAGLLKTFLLMTGAAPIAIPIGFVFLEAVPETIANCILYVILLVFLTGIIGSIVLARRQPKEDICPT